MGATSLVLSRLAGLAARHIRLTTLLCIVLICGSFAAAAVLQLRMGKAQAMRLATALEIQRDQEVALSIGLRLDRNGAVAARFAGADFTQTDSEELTAGRLGALRGVTRLDRSGAVLGGIGRQQPRGLPHGLLARALNKRALAVVGSQLLLAFPQNGHVTLANLDLASLFPGADLKRSALTLGDGTVLLSGQAWHLTALPPELGPQDGAVVVNGQLISAAAVPGWALRIASTLDADIAVGTWIGSLPLYLFVILGPALVGAGLAMVFVREFERRAHAHAALRRLRNTAPDEAKLLIRLAEAERRASEAERSKAEFMAHMSHELRTPLNAIIGFSEIISHGFFGQPGHPKYAEYARDIGAAGRELHGKIGDILEFANLEAERHPIALTAVDVCAIAQTCVQEIAGRAFSRRIDVQVTGEAHSVAHADGRAVKRILSNLLYNAVNFTPDGGKVEIEIGETEADVFAHVRDTGDGFSPEEAVQAGEAFMVFERVGAVTGIGLGLAIAAALAKRMDGEMLLLPTSGPGSTAQLRLKKG